MELSYPKKNLIKLFHTLDKTPLGETACLSNLYYLLAAQASSFSIHSLFQTQSVRTPLVPSKNTFSKLLSQKIDS